MLSRVTQRNKTGMCRQGIHVFRMGFANPRMDFAASPQTTDKLTRDKRRYMISQAARKNTGQFCQKAEATLS